MTTDIAYDTTGGLDISYEDGKYFIRREGKVSKFVDKAQSITYSVSGGVRQDRAL